MKRRRFLRTMGGAAAGATLLQGFDSQIVTTLELFCGI